VQLPAAIILGFEPISRSWVSEVSALPIIGIPPLDGVLLTDPGSLIAGSKDFGNIIHRRPIAVLKPGSVNDIILMVRYAREQRLTIAARGQGHTTFGQSLVNAGIQIDMAALVKPPVITGNRVKVSAGMVWRDLISATLPHSLTVPVLTGYIGLSIGGTLSVGGIGANSFRYGAQVDNVHELEVVTGEGKLEVCSATKNPALFNAALAGLGQCAIIIRATLRLIPAHTHARLFNLFYPDIHTMLQDERLLINDGRFDLVIGFVVPSPAPTGGWLMFIEASRYFTPPNEPDNADLLAGLSFIPGPEQISDLEYFPHATRVDPLVNFVKASGRFDLPHPWLDIFVPDSKIDEYAGEIFETLTPDDLGPD
jgi:cytokinin dehydrogenase